MISRLELVKLYYTLQAHFFAKFNSNEEANDKLINIYPPPSLALIGTNMSNTKQAITSALKELMDKIEIISLLRNSRPVLASRNFFYKMQK
jgi:hypothetical protein